MSVGRTGGNLSDFEYDHPEILEGGPAVSEGAESEAAAVEAEGRALSDFEYDHPEILDGGPAVSEGAESEAAAIEAARTRAATEGTKALNFSGFRAGDLVFLRDGGSVLFGGMLDRSISANLRYDGALNSPTRGEVCVKTKHFARPEDPERPLTAGEKKDLVKAIKGQIKNPAPDDDVSALKLLLERLKAPAPARPEVREHNFSGYAPSSITMYRDGGTIKMQGLINRSYEGTVRCDGRIGSPTRGQFFCTVKHFSGSAEPERPMTRGEIEGLQTALKRYVKENPAANPTYAQLLERIGAALKAMK